MGCVLTQCISRLSQVRVLTKLRIKLFVSVKYFAIKFLLCRSGNCELLSHQDYGLCVPSNVKFLTITTNFLIVI